ncbi:MAG: glycosyltransferase family 4 protein [Gammaproteobacteria bacterium]|nr:glycosyltransferase family 4 protein [Gammaproteobacteria bacterium]
MKIWIPAVKAGTGADTFFLNLARGLGRRGVIVEVSWFHRLAELLPHLLARARIPKGTDIIHTNSWYGFAFGRHAPALIVTVLHWVHSPDFKRRRGPLQGKYHDWLIRRYEHLSLARAKCVTAISNYTARQVSSDIPSISPVVIHPGVDTETFKPRSEPGPRARQFRLLHLGSPSRRKGFHLLPEIMKRLGDDFLLHYNKGPARPRATNMRYLGELDLAGLVREYQSCDALIFPTRYEGFGYVAAEAMSCGKPVIATDCSALPELVADGGTGILCPADDVNAFVAAAKRLREDSEACTRMGEAARQRMLAQYRLDTMIDRYLELYRAVAG